MKIKRMLKVFIILVCIGAAGVALPVIIIKASSSKYTTSCGTRETVAISYNIEYAFRDLLLAMQENARLVGIDEINNVRSYKEIIDYSRQLVKQLNQCELIEDDMDFSNIDIQYALCVCSSYNMEGECVTDQVAEKSGIGEYDMNYKSLSTYLWLVYIPGASNEIAFLIDDKLMKVVGMKIYYFKTLPNVDIVSNMSDFIRLANEQRVCTLFEGNYDNFAMYENSDPEWRCLYRTNIDRYENSVSVNWDFIFY